mgnify:FL=1|jgi:hypothetical protein|tara:strand:- start:167 stop:340 length:174 start_codon:yes stop_codon:yes gene_type:complete
MKVVIKDLKKPIPMWDSYSGLHTEDWRKLNKGEVVDLKEIPELAQEYVKQSKSKESE